MIQFLPLSHDSILSSGTEFMHAQFVTFLNPQDDMDENWTKTHLVCALPIYLFYWKPQ